ncbi:MAG: hypothetical protein HYV61_07190 [Candidatus Rokubacteria bacterium]|nr:hypothetical protein [Candidatus Rokubacteria bacterium]
MDRKVIIAHAAARTREPEPHPCWVCGTPMREIHCKLICPHCGYTRDCSDP